MSQAEHLIPDIKFRKLRNNLSRWPGIRACKGTPGNSGRLAASSTSELIARHSDARNQL